MAKKWAKPDPYATYTDGNCRDVSGQIVPCSSDTAVSPPKFGEDEAPDAETETDGED